MIAKLLQALINGEPQVNKKTIGYVVHMYLPQGHVHAKIIAADS
jgi:hypothetical protein